MGRLPFEGLAVIERSDIEAKARELEEAVLGAGEAVRNAAAKKSLGVAAALAAAFLAGRKRGRRRGARVEIHRL